MFQEIRIAPSILSGDFMNMASSIQQIESAAEWVHVDVMDGHFVPNITIGVPFTKQLRQITRYPIDAHLMVENPMREYPWFLEAGADYITMHAEVMAPEEVRKAAEDIHGHGAKIGISIKPKTSTDVLEPYLPLLDMVLVMSVEPGFSGQGYIEGSEEKVTEVVAMAEAAGCAPLIQVDGGISAKTAARVAAAGADVLVCGNAFFKAEDPVRAAEEIKAIAQTAQRDAG